MPVACRVRKPDGILCPAILDALVVCLGKLGARRESVSHFTTLKTRIVSMDYLKQALEDLGIQYQEGEVEIRGYQGIRTPVELCIATSNPEYQIGFRKTDDTYELVADWYGIEDLTREEFLGRVTQKYSYLVAKDLLEQQDFTVVEEEVDADHTIRLTLRRMT